MLLAVAYIAAIQIAGSILVGQWLADGTLLDIGPNARHGTVLTAADTVTLQFADPAIKNNQGFTFSSGLIQVSYFDITVEETRVAWVKSTTKVNQDLFMAWNSAGSADAAYSTLRIDNSGFPVMLVKNNAGTGSTNAMGKKLITDGTWHHVAGTRSASNILIFVDGVLDGTGAVTVSTAANAVRIGAQSIGMQLLRNCNEL
eukprot:NODE_3266_length_1249_cov_76.129663_g3101_i0.p1 GENE.NODE_3266_length_1249_cov_76.129663_g3101_i0~~NODE_3266_length_1249_cov_76.129663_g3101_i0.p1  ORF type:complete len:210 (-),score=24.76 NODE_3266_length_1249_cov_76.129663_g3101_i0:619-1221(-)